MIEHVYEGHEDGTGMPYHAEKINELVDAVNALTERLVTLFPPNDRKEKHGLL